MNQNQPRRLGGPSWSADSGISGSLMDIDPYGHIRSPSPTPSLGSLNFGGHDHGDTSRNARVVHNYFLGRHAMCNTGNNFVFQNPGNYNLNIQPPVMQVPNPFNSNQNGTRLRAPMPIIPTAIGAPRIIRAWSMAPNTHPAAPMNQLAPRGGNGFSPPAFPQRGDIIPSVDQVDLTSLHLSESSNNCNCYFRSASSNGDFQ